MNENIKYLVKTYSVEDIENAAIKHFLYSNTQGFVFVNKLINNRISNVNDDCLKYLINNIKIKSLNDLDKFFESIISQKTKTENGIVFTPDFVSDYIVKNTIKNFDDTTKIIDPSCGCGIFLISILNYLKKKYKNKNIIDFIEKNIYGIDLDKNNVERLKIILSLYCIVNGYDVEEIEFNIAQADAIFSDWNDLFGIEKFDYIVGNPPYINNHDLKEEYIEKLKNNFTTTVEGTFNIFYAFIEHSMKFLKDDGMLGYIVPNNFIHIQSAKELRKFIKNNHYLNRIIDFKDNTIFYPILTYNCIIFLSNNNSKYKFAQIERNENIKGLFSNIKYNTSSIDNLDDNGWKLVSDDSVFNIKQIENKAIKLDTYIKIGIATLRDKVFKIDEKLYDNNKKMFYKEIEGEKYYIENDLINDYIKVSKFKYGDTPGKIIFPYHIKENGVIPVTEKELQDNYPLAYKYFLKEKETLDERDTDGSLDNTPWFLYGRSQGLNNWTRKIIFSTFNENPNFIPCDYNTAVFSNGYSIVGVNLDEDVLLKILNSCIMKYYIDNTSYSISGNYKCYQKKYVKNFSIPELTSEDIKFIKNNKGKELDEFLIKLYNLKGDIL